jgi:hypothetical protein
MFLILFYLSPLQMSNNAMILLVLKKLGWKIGQACKYLVHYFSLFLLVCFLLIIISPYPPGVIRINSLGKFRNCEPAILPDHKTLEKDSLKCDVFDMDLLNNIWFGLFVTMMCSSLLLLIGCVRQG